MENTANSRIYLITAALVFFVLNFILKFIHLETNPLSGDEPFSVFHSQMPVGDIIYQLSLGNNPPLWEIILHFWIKIFGISEISVRFLPLVFISATASLVFIAGERYFKKHVGITAAFIFTLANIQFAFAHEARVYALFQMLSLLSFIFCWEITRKKNNSINILIALTLTNVLLLYSHYFSFWVLAIQFAFITNYYFISKTRRLSIFLPFVVALIFYIPNFGIFFTRFFASTGNGTWVPKPNGISTLYTFIWDLSNSPLGATTCLSILVIGIIYLSIKRNLDCLKTLALTSLVPILLIYGLSFKMPMFMDRYMLFTATGFYLLIAYIIWSVPKLFSYISLAPLSIIMLFTIRMYKDNYGDTRALATVAAEYADEHTAIFVQPEWLDLSFCYYYDRTLFSSYKTVGYKYSTSEEWATDNLFAIRDSSQIKSFMRDDFSTYMLVDFNTASQFPTNGARQFLSNKRPIIHEQEFGHGLNLVVFR